MQKIDFDQFKHLLRSLENTANVLIRFRNEGETWTDFSRVVLASDNALMFEVGTARGIILNIRRVIEFELDEAHLEFLPKHQYRIDHG